MKWIYLFLALAFVFLMKNCFSEPKQKIAYSVENDDHNSFENQRKRAVAPKNEPQEIKIDIRTGHYWVNSTLNVRETPSLTSAVLGQFNRNQKIYVNTIEGEWAKVQVQFSDGSTKDCYVYTKYITAERDFFKAYEDYNNPKRYNNYKTYDYSVTGYGDNGDVYGDVTVDKNGGDGYLYDDEGNEISVDVDWTGYGTLEGYDEEGNYYDLEVD